MDLISTWAAFTYSPVQIREIDVLVDALAPYIGFNTALGLTIPIAFGAVYVFYPRYPAVAEWLALVLPLIVISNFLFLASPTVWLVGAGTTILVMGGYIVYRSYKHYQTTETWRDYFTTMPAPCLWTGVIAISRDPSDHVPDRYQIPCHDCGLTTFRNGNGYVKAAIASIWLIVGGAAGFTVSAILLLLQRPVGIWGVLVFGAAVGVGYVGMLWVVVVHSVHQVLRDLWPGIGPEETGTGDRK